MPTIEADVRRVAIAIGNRQYENAACLRTPAADAVAMNDLLKRLGFEAEDPVLDADWNAFKSVLLKFESRLASADLAVFFYAGHSIQVDSVNYLLPVDADIQIPDSLSRHAFSLDSIVASLKSNARTSIVMLDGCRDNPFGTALRLPTRDRKSVVSPFESPGPAPISLTSDYDVGILFATSEGQTAEDHFLVGDRRSEHSPFTASLLSGLETEGVSFQSLVPRITEQVIGCTKTRQRPWLISSLSKEIFLKPRQTPPKQETIEPPLRPDIWNVPQWPSNYFTGRGKLLQELRNLLCNGGPVHRAQALHGLGGMGKTQIAVEFAHKYASDYSLVWWLRAESAAGLASDYAAFAKQLGPKKVGLAESQASDQPQVVRVVREWLETNGNWLLIFDNVGDPADVAAYLPRGSNGHVLITSREPSWQGRANPQKVRELDECDAAEFLLQRTGASDLQSAKKLAGHLGSLPLALEHAGAYIVSSGCQISAYMQLFITKRQELIKKRTKAPENYPYTIATTWEISFKKLKREEVGLLNLCAFLAPESISRTMLIGGAASLPEWLARTLTDQLAWDKVMEGLRHYSLLERSNDVLGMHQLVRFMLYDRLSKKHRLFWATAAIKMLVQVFPKDDPNGRDPEYDSLIPHVLAACGYAEELGVELKNTCLLLNKVGRYLRILAQLTESRGVLERALAIAERAYPKGDSEIAVVRNNVGRTLHSLSENRAAFKAFYRALKDHRAVHGPINQRVSRDLNDFGSVLMTLKRPKRAIKFLRQAVEVDEHLHGPFHPDVARDIANVGRILFELNDLEGACGALEKALRIHEHQCGLQDARVAPDLSSLGKIYRAMGQISGARNCFARALEIRRRVLGEQHQLTLTVRERLDSLSGLEDTVRDPVVFGPTRSPASGGTIDLTALRQVLCELGEVASVEDLGAGGPLRASAGKTSLFHCLFGRDSIRMASDLIEDFPDLAQVTLTSLAALQGVRTSERSEEEPGRFIHENRRPDDPHAVRLSEYWDWPYYGAVDTTPQWINLLAQFTSLSGSEILDRTVTDRRSHVVSLRESLMRAVEWLLGRLDNPIGAGFLWVRRASEGGNRNQVWEDSSDAFHDEQGQLFDPALPFAPIIVQGYAYDALIAAAGLLEAADVPAPLNPALLRQRAERLRADVIETFWQPDLHTFAHAVKVDRDGKAIAVPIVASAPGHLLASKILDGADAAAKRDALVRRLFKDDLLAAAGIRTKSTHDPLFRAGAYHNGSVWPTDTGAIADGLRKHGFTDEADDLDNRIISACSTVAGFPEFFRGETDGRICVNREAVTYQRNGRIHFREQPPQSGQGWTATRVWRILRRRRLITRQGFAHSANSTRW